MKELRDIILDRKRQGGVLDVIYFTGEAWDNFKRSFNTQRMDAPDINKLDGVELKIGEPDPHRDRFKNVLYIE